MTISFHADGSATALWREHIDLAQLGRLEMSRATTIDFNQAEQVWQVRTPDGRTVLFSSTSRNACLAWEDTHFE
jgi:hypothetical protein